MLFPKLSVFEVNYNALSTPLDTVLKFLQQMTQLIRIFQTFMEDINNFSLRSGHVYLSPRGWATFGGHQTFYTGFGVTKILTPVLRVTIFVNGTV